MEYIIRLKICWLYSTNGQDCGIGWTFDDDLEIVCYRAG
jgi:hypothetical protein